MKRGRFASHLTRLRRGRGGLATRRSVAIERAPTGPKPLEVVAQHGEAWPPATPRLNPQCKDQVSDDALGSEGPIDSTSFVSI